MSYVSSAVRRLLPRKPIAVEALRGALGSSEIEAIRSELVLGERPRRYRCPVDKVLIMLFAARSGSTYAGQLLANHPAFGRINEWLNPAWLRRVREKHGLADDRDAAQWLLDEHSGKAFGFECTTVGLVASALVGLLDEILPRATFIVLRRDPVSQAVSLHRAQISGRFNSAQPSVREVTERDFDYDRIAACRAVIETVYANHAKSLGALRHRANTYWYEDVVADPAGFQRSVYGEIGLEYTTDIGLDARIERLSDEINESWIARFRKIEAAR